MNERGHYGNGGRLAHIGAAGTIEPRFAALRRAVKAIFYLHDRVRAPYYVYTEVDGHAEASAVQSGPEAFALATAFDRMPGEIYTAIFSAADPTWPDPTHQTYHAAVADRVAVAGRGQYRRGAFIGASSDATAVTVDIPTKGADYGDIMNAQLMAMIHGRGEDRSAISPFRIPRSTNNDARLLVTYWTKALQDTVKAKKNPSLIALAFGPVAAWATQSVDIPGSLGELARITKLWRLAAADVDALAQGNDDGVYVKNADLWHAIFSLGNGLAVLMEAPTSFDISLSSTAHYVAHPGEGLTKTFEAAKDAGKKLLDGPGKYILIGAGVIAAALAAGAIISHTGKS